MPLFSIKALHLENNAKGHIQTPVAYSSLSNTVKQKQSHNIFAS